MFMRDKHSSLFCSAVTELKKKVLRNYQLVHQKYECLPLKYFLGAKTLSITAFSIMTLGINDSIALLSVMTLGIMTT
jgi:hypothetical protein